MTPSVLPKGTGLSRPQAQSPSLSLSIQLRPTIPGLPPPGPEEETESPPLPSQGLDLPEVMQTAD